MCRLQPGGLIHAQAGTATATKGTGGFNRRAGLGISAQADFTRALLQYRFKNVRNARAAWRKGMAASERRYRVPVNIDSAIVVKISNRPRPLKLLLTSGLPRPRSNRLSCVPESGRNAPGCASTVSTLSPDQPCDSRYAGYRKRQRDWQQHHGSWPEPGKAK